MKIVALSDTHAEHRHVTVPDGDVLVFAGDLMTCGRRFAEVVSFCQWFKSQPHKYKILVAGNHDRLFESQLPMCRGEMGATVRYLQDSGTEIDGIKFWGSPYQPWFMDWAFNVHRGEQIKRHWDLIPADTDVLITHGPAYGVLDQMTPEGLTSSWGSKLIIPPSEHLGCEELRTAVDRVNPKVHIFGHIHGSHGSQGYTDWEACRLMMPRTPTRYFNVAICDEQYNPTNPVTVIEV